MNPWNQLDPMERAMYSQRLFAKSSAITAAVAIPTFLVLGLGIAAVLGGGAFGLAYAYYYAKIGREIAASRA